MEVFQRNKSGKNWEFEVYKIIFSKKALEFLNKIPTHYQAQVKNRSEQLSLNPFALDIKQLSSNYTATHRLRIGNYRLFLKINSEDKIIQIDNIERRTTQTYH